ncbi:MAG: hypothetical protein ABJE95_16360 [Byssovorax sp.]
MRLVSLFASSYVALALSGCVVSSRSDPPVVVVGDGALVIEWTINGSTDPHQCSQESATRLEIIVDPGVGQPSAFSQDCEAFSAAITLAPGSYSASAVLVDESGKARTTQVDIDPFTIRGNDELHTPIDFPASSFF